MKLKNSLAGAILAAISMMALPAFAEKATFEATGNYVYTEGLVENEEVAKVLAKEDALKKITKQSFALLKKNHKRATNVIAYNMVSNRIHEDFSSKTDANKKIRILECKLSAEGYTENTSDSGLSTYLIHEKYKKRFDALKKEAFALKAAYKKAATKEEKIDIQKKFTIIENKLLATDCWFNGDYQEAIELDPNFAEAYIEEVHRLRNGEDVVKYCTKAIELQPNNYYAYYLRCKSALYNGDYELAIKDHAKLKNINPEKKLKANPYGPIDDMFSMYYYMGFAQSSWGHPFMASEEWMIEPKETINFFTEAIKENVNPYFAYVFRGLAYDKIGETEKALADFTKALETPHKKIDSWIVYSARAKHFSANDKKQALVDYIKAAEFAPKNLYILYGECFDYEYKPEQYKKAIEMTKEIGEYKKALELCNSLIKYSDNYSEFWHGRDAYRLRADVYSRMGNYDSALADYKMLLYKISPFYKKLGEDSPLVAVYDAEEIATAYEKAGKLDLALKDADEAIFAITKLLEEMKKNNKVNESKRDKLRRGLSVWYGLKCEVYQIKNMDELALEELNKMEHYSSYVEETKERIMKKLAKKK